MDFSSIVRISCQIMIFHDLVLSLKAEIVIDRKILAELAVNEPEAFKKIFEISQSKLA